MSDYRDVAPTRRRIVICGSMAHYDRMLTCQRELEAAGIYSIVPVEEGERVRSMSPEQFSDFKRVVSRKWLTEIRRQATFGVLAVNLEKHGEPNYIGANTFAEIAIAFNAKKAIYLLRDHYEVYRDELAAWGAVPLLGDLTRLIDDYKHDPEQAQLSLFGQRD